jgi:hypothetical protein
MELILTVANILLAVVLAGIAGIWIYLLAYMGKSFRHAPKLESFDRASASKFPKVSVILPARNEERYIARCLDSLLAQDYPNFEVVVINDSSTDGTGEIMQQYAARDSRIVYMSAPPKPEGWAGKNWACYEGYLRAKGELLMFTDADTEHSSVAMSLAVGHLVSQNTRFSPLRVNDPDNKTGYFFGSFFVITRAAYEAVGTHKGVRQELVEDGALGGKVKEGGFLLKMVRGEHYIDAVWARDLYTMWHGLRRLMIPLYYQNKSRAFLMMIAVFFILFAPFATLPYSILAAGLTGNLSAEMLLAIQLAAVALAFATTAVQCSLGVFESPAYALASPLSGAIVSFSFMSAIVDADKKGAVNWRDREYTVSENQHPIR